MNYLHDGSGDLPSRLSNVSGHDVEIVGTSDVFWTPDYSTPSRSSEFYWDPDKKALAGMELVDERSKLLTRKARTNVGPMAQQSYREEVPDKEAYIYIVGFSEAYVIKKPAYQDTV